MLTINLSMGFLLGAAVLVALLAHWLRGLARAMLTQQRIDATTSAAEEMAVRVAARFMTKLLAQPDVHAAVTNLIAQGITAWIKDPDGQAELHKLLDTATDAEQARDLGKRLPSMLAGFTKGVIDGVRKRPASAKATIADAPGSPKSTIADAPGSPAGAAPPPPQPPLADQPAPASHDKPL